MKDIRILLQDGTVCEFVGEVMLDPAENSLIVYEDDAVAHITFYWPFVAFYIVTPLEETEDE
ncbi:hypothetical protein [Nocardia abscessus]|uniref:hypothetical protein n=1 Tax=Nocardia abscessus TaxID=120957 RepID=UPI0024547742|nr:hypothetical protein [Nocardia abscessus]